jgi:hypothetical protein
MHLPEKDDFKTSWIDDTIEFSKDAMFTLNIEDGNNTIKPLIQYLRNKKRKLKFSQLRKLKKKI